MNRPVDIVAARSKAWVFGCFDTEILGSNPAQDLDVYPRRSVLCCPMGTEAWRGIDPCPGSPIKCRTDR
jgi:hypothetical protein